MHVTIWMKQIICESMLDVVGQVMPYVEGVLQCVVGVNPVCIWRDHLQGRTGITTGCSQMKHLVRTERGDVRKDEGKITTRVKTNFAGRERAPPSLGICHCKWWGARSG